MLQKLRDYDLVLQSSPNLIEFGAPINQRFWCMTNDGWDVVDAAVMAWAATLPNYDWHTCPLTMSFAGIGTITINVCVTRAHAKGWDTREAVSDYAYCGISVEAN